MAGVVGPPDKTLFSLWLEPRPSGSSIRIRVDSKPHQESQRQKDTYRMSVFI